MKLFLLHPDGTVRTITQHLLSGSIEVVAGAEWASLASDLLQANPKTDLVVCAEQLGTLTGVELCRILRRYQPEIPLWIVSSEPSRVSAPPSVEVFRERDLVATVRDRLRQARSPSDAHQRLAGEVARRAPAATGA